MSEMLAKRGICVRTGTHCAMPLHQALQIPATVRASFGIYSSLEDVERLVRAVEEAKEEFGCCE